MAVVRAAALAGLLLEWIEWPVFAFSHEDTECRTGETEFPAFLQMGLNLQSLGAESRGQVSTLPADVRGRGLCPSLFPRCDSLPQICENSSPNMFRVGTASAGSARDPENLALDLTNALRGGMIQILVMALFKQGSYTDEQGLLAERATPLEDSSSTLLELRLSGDGRSVDVYKPVMDLRTSDPQSRHALRAGIGNGLQASLPRLHCIGAAGAEDRIIVDMSSFLELGFFVVDTGDLGFDVTVIKAKEFPTNLDITADYGPSVPLLRVGYSVVLLPETAMEPRENDDRLLYFDTQYQDKGSHKKKAHQKLSEAVDSHISMIWRYNLRRLPGHTIRFYVDPSVPARWRPYFKKGVEAWNEAFTLIERPQAVRAMLPEDEDWPADYDMSDARFSAITWDTSEETLSMGIAKVDPRSGEILKCDVIMGDSWVKTYLDELEMEFVNFTNFLSKTPSVSVLLHQDVVEPGQTSTRRILELLQQGSTDRKSRSFGFAAAYMQKRLRRSELEALLGSGLQEIVTHEVGHCLGLRHNFKGSMGVSHECLRDLHCTAVHGTTASVMDYVPVNLPRPGDSLTHVWSPTIGEYDKLAIRYGYTHIQSPLDASTEEILEDVRRRAEGIQTCYDDDLYLGEDPSCLDYDLSADPVHYWDQQLDLYADIQNHLLEMSVAPSESYSLYGKAVHSVVGGFLPEIGINAVYYLGGINNTYLHKYTDQTRRSRQPMPAETQRRALAVILRILRPKTEGLLPPDANLPYLVDGDQLQGAIESLDLTGLVRRLRRLLLEEALRSERLLQLYKQETLLIDGEAEVFPVSEFLSTLVYGVMSAGLDRITSDDERDLQRTFVQILTSKFPAQAQVLPAEVMTQLQYFHSFVYEMTEGALDRLPTTARGAEWAFCAAFNKTCTCTGLVRVRLANISSSGQWSGTDKACLPSHFAINASTDSQTSWCECLSLTKTDLDQREAQRLHVEALRHMLRPRHSALDGLA